MTVAEIFEQVKALSPQERDEFLYQLISITYPEVEDPVEWVKEQLEKRREQRLKDRHE